VLWAAGLVDQMADGHAQAAAVLANGAAWSRLESLRTALAVPAGG